MEQESKKEYWKKVWQRDRKKYIALSALCILLAIFRQITHSRAASDFAVHYIVQPYHRVMGYLCGFVPFSVAEVFWAAVVVFCIVYAVRTVANIIRTKGGRLALLWRAVLTYAVLVLGIYTAFTGLWGLTYYAQTFEQAEGIEAKPISVDQLAEVTQLFVDKINAAAPLTEHTAPGKLSGDLDAILKASDTVYDHLERQFPFLNVPAVRPKLILCSRMMSAVNFTGFFFPFTGEANINADAPECLLPATVAHELAHVRGIAPEQTANFAAILACDTSGDPMYAYSGYLLGYIHLSNALYSASPERWAPIARQLCDTAKSDLNANNEYWRQFESPVSSAAENTYSGFLQSYDQELGIKSYGAVVDLLAAYYGTREK